MASTPAGSSTTRDKKKKSVNSSSLCSVDPQTGVVYHSDAERLEGRHRAIQNQKKQMKAIQMQMKQTKASIGSSSPPKNSSEKKEYVKPSGTGHEASGAGDGGDGKRDDKKDHECGRDKKKDEGLVYCVKCEHFFSSEEFLGHDCKY